MTLGSIIKKYRIENNFTVKEFADKCSLSKGYISMLENGVNPRNKKPIAPTLPSLQKVALGLDIDIDTLMKMLDAEQQVTLSPSRASQNNISKARRATINVLGRVAAGIPIDAITEIIDTEEITEEMAKTGDFFGLKIKGDSMIPNICDGDIVIVRQQNDAESGDIVIATVNGNEATCKRLRKYRDGIELISINPSYVPMEYSNEDIESKPVRIIGKVIELRRKF